MAKQKEQQEIEEQNVILEQENSSNTDEQLPMEFEEITLVSSAEYWTFEEKPEFIGIYQGEVHSQKEDDNGKVIGYNFVDKDGELHIISNNSAIERGLDMEVQGKTVRESGYFVRIVYIDKVTLQNGKPYKRFKVSVLAPKAK